MKIFATLLAAISLVSIAFAAPAPTKGPATNAPAATAPSAAAKTGKDAKAERKAKPIFAPSKNPATPNWVVVDYKSDTPGNVFYNTETVKLSLTLASKDPQKPLTIKKGSWQIKEIDDQDNFPYKGEQRVLETDAVSGEGAIGQPSGGKVPVTIEWKPTHLGAYGVYLKVDDGSGADPQIVWGFAVVYPPAPGRKLDSPIIFNLGVPNTAPMGPAIKRLGGKWIRGEVGWASNEKQQGEWDWTVTEAWVKAAKDNDLYVADVMAHAPDWAKPKIDGTIPIFYWKSIPETNVTPQYLPQWQEWAKQFVTRFKDTVRAGIVLNEPWEGGSLSGWDGTGAHYREIFKSFSIGAHAGDPTFKVIGNDSSMNIEDNLLVEPGLVNYADAFSIHTFRSFNAFVVPEFASYGKQVWDTESWVGTGPTNLVEQVAFELAQGLVKVQPINEPFGFFNFKPPKPIRPANNKKTKTESAPALTEAAFQPMYASPTAQGVSVLLHFIEDTDFYHEASPESVPWMFVFKGRKSGPSPDKNVAIIQGHDFKWDNFPWYQVKSDGHLTVSDPDNVLTAYDIKGNPLPRTGKSFTIPLTTKIYYVVSSKGADDLTQHLKDATVQGLEPVEIALNDFTKPLSQNPPLRVKVSNNYNVPISGTVEVKAPEGWKMADASLPFSDLKPGESKELSFKVAGTKPVPINRYPFTITAKTDKGNAVWSEQLSSTLLVKGTPPLDGKAEDWQKLGAVPVFLSGSITAADSFLQYTMPFLNLQAENDTAYVVQFMGMWDDKNFYILADVNDPTEKHPVSMAKGTWFTLHAPPNDFDYWGPHAPPGSGGDRLNIAFNVLPYGEKQMANYPPAAQKKLDPKWRIDPADYEYSLYLGKQSQLVKGDYQKAVEEFKAEHKSNTALRPPTFEEVGPPIPEVWRSMAPGLARNNVLATSPHVEKGQGLVTSVKLNITREGNVYHYRAAIPWSEMPMVKPLATAGQPIKFTFVGVNDGRHAVSWSNETRSVAKQGQEVLHPTFAAAWSPDTEWGFVDLAAAPKP